jgi:adenosylcobinamide-GDP ribazoletransferase
VYNSAAYFPLIGALQGLFLAFLAYILLKIMSAEIAAAFILSLYVLITGGFHQDGLSDTFDALSVKSSGDREKDMEKRLQVMKDSTIGPIGVIATVLFLLLKYLFMKEILRDNQTDRYLLFFLMPVFSKWAMVTTMYHSVSARVDGIGRTFLEHVGLKQVSLATAILTAFLAGWCLLHCFIRNSPEQWIALCVLFFFFEAVLILLISLVLKHLFTLRFGGLTGDNFGAIHEIAEITFLVTAILAQ